MSNSLFNRTINIKSFPLKEDNSGYVADEALIQAIEMAIALHKPLIVSGEPGTGKTRLAHWVAAQLHRQTQNQEYPFLPEALVFNTKSISTAADLFYHYDAVSHFQNKDNQPTEQFIELCAMGKAIAQSHGKEAKNLEELKRLKDFQKLSNFPCSSVVLIDEIDKAPRDFPNDLLNEIERYQFRIKELNLEIETNKNARMLVILTSNSEKSLPNAFLRRCIFYHIPFPNEEKLLKIATARLGKDQPSFAMACKKFMEYRQKALNKKPATSEFLDWLRILDDYGLLNISEFGMKGNQEQQLNYRTSLNALVKTKEDIEKIESLNF
ncbi:AAA family ATPase [Chitinophaga tropicalis]|uniref:AAA family ATPase n=1 Tax=Chitinophaga tropicalis TaxID=2683588 RepID=A0A7K1U7E9_9BACT|nr:MoxR family ATPase [Chitinophaga tropicalis]MVT10288.1 AAA family ATPase [Chitinophaga tropicalis]